jgi:hypothetical protein
MAPLYSTCLFCQPWNLAIAILEVHLAVEDHVINSFSRTFRDVELMLDQSRYFCRESIVMASMLAACQATVPVVILKNATVAVIFLFDKQWMPRGNRKITRVDARVDIPFPITI